MTRDPWPLVLTMLATLLFGLMANAGIKGWMGDAFQARALVPSAPEPASQSRPVRVTVAIAGEN